jgi:hypothetical protein
VTRVLALLTLVVSLAVAPTALAVEPPPTFTVSLSGDVKPLPWHMQNAVAGKVVAW